jgi:hypothetical protein
MYNIEIEENETGEEGCVEEVANAYFENMMGRDQFSVFGVHGRIILN